MALWRCTVVVAASLCGAAIACGGSSVVPDEHFRRASEHGRIDAHDEAERALLAGLGGGSGASTLRIAGWTVAAGEVYAAASGLRCRTVRFEDGAAPPAWTSRVVCEDGLGWFFAPEVSTEGPLAGDGS